MLTLDDLFAKIEDEGFFIDEMNQKNNVGQAQWRVLLRAVSKYDKKAFSHFPGEGPTLRDALQQAAGNGGAISGRRSSEKSDKALRKVRSAEDLLG